MFQYTFELSSLIENDGIGGKQLPELVIAINFWKNQF